MPILFPNSKSSLIGLSNGISFVSDLYSKGDLLRGDGTGGAGGAIAPPAFTNLI